jgi:hypothetical protein
VSLSISSGGFLAAVGSGTEEYHSVLCHIREVMRNLSPLYLHETPLHLKQGICVVVNDTIYSSLAN